MESDVKIIAFYLPQFHAIPENDKAYGKGFTEWTNVRKATPLFDGHYQPKVPLNQNYYTLLDPTVMENQARMAKQYGIYGFCYYHYWFSGGKKLLEKPIEMMLEHREIDIPFCLCWANENWSKRWDGGDNEVIARQTYGDIEDLRVHMNYLCNFFADERYIKIDGQPLLLLYKPELIPNIDEVISTIRNCAAENGYREIKIAVQYPKYYRNGAMLHLFDYYIQFQPAQIFEAEVTWRKVMRQAMNTFGLGKIANKLRNSNAYYVIKQMPSHHDYDEAWEYIIKQKVNDNRLIAGAFVDWDNTARTKAGHVFDGVSPEKFGFYFEKLINKVNNEYSTKVVFINAWNEWAEGCYLEPDERNGYGYLNAIRNAIM